jgi:hypothetical protein
VAASRHGALVETAKRKQRRSKGKDFGKKRSFCSRKPVMVFSLLGFDPRRKTQKCAIVDDWADFSHGSEFECPTQKTFIFSFFIPSFLFFLNSLIVFMASPLSYSSLDDIQDAVSCLRVNFDTGNAFNNRLYNFDLTKEPTTHLVSLCHG